MTGYNSISEFLSFPFRQLTVVEYDRRGRVFSVKSGQILSRPLHHYTTSGDTYLGLRLHEIVSDEQCSRGFGAVYDLSLWCENSDEHLDWKIVAGGQIGILGGFRRDNRFVDVFAHARTTR